MTQKIKPMLAATCKDLAAIQYPVVVSPKLDGIRALVIDGVLVSRTLKPIPNAQLQARYGRPEFEGLDGELIFGSPTAPDVFNKTTSCVMTRNADADCMMFYVFDKLGAGSYIQRIDNIPRSRAIKHVTQSHCYNSADVQNIENQLVEAGYEGIMLRDPQGRYKYGRSTLKEQLLMKYKRFDTSEAIIVGFEEKTHNANDATLDARGYTKRSSHQENQIPAGTLGALIVKDLTTGVEFNIGTGFNDEQRKVMWDNQPFMLGRVVSYQYFPIGVVDKPRFPSFRGLRDTIDIGEAHD